jgi:hypothetical protein
MPRLRRMHPFGQLPYIKCLLLCRNSGLYAAWSGSQAAGDGTHNGAAG